MLLSIIIPCKNEVGTIENTIKIITNKIKEIDYELILINDFSSDATLDIINKISESHNKINCYDNKIKGLGGAIDLGIKKSRGKYVIIFMADLSDDVEDIKKYLKIATSNDNLDGVFGSRFLNRSSVKNYPIKKLILNRIFNYFVKIIFFSKFNDFTNAFKLYKRETLLKLYPLVSENFNIFLELPLKIISRNYNYAQIEISWQNRKSGVSKFNIKELSSKYFFTLLYCFIEKHLLKKNLK